MAIISSQKISILLPSIRTEKLQNVYDSIVTSFSGEFELVIVGVNNSNLPIQIKAIDRGIWTFIPSHRSPNAAQQIALLNARYEMISFCADDGVFLPRALDKAMDLIKDYEEEYYINNMEPCNEFIVVGKYLEGDNPHPDMHKEDYYKFKYHKAYRLKGVPQEEYIFNCGIITNSFIRELGGWDAESFEATTMAHADLGIRAKKAGAGMILMDMPMFKCSHQPGKTGDHGPVHYAMKSDIKKFQKIYSKSTNRQNIALDNWQYTPERWERRFK